MLNRILTLAVCLSLVGCASTPQTTDTGAADQLPTSASLGDKDIVAIAVPSAGKCCDKQTLPQFLGLDSLGAGIGGIFQKLFSRLITAFDLQGKFPALQPKPALKSLTDPANLGEDASPAQQAAAKVKAEEDKAEQKIMSLRYLATVGCGGCYPEVEDALLAALDDCTEKVRYEAVKALRGGKQGRCCRYCNQNGCCSAKVQKKLREVVSKVDDSGAYVEKSERVRRLARLVLEACPPAMEAPGVPEEGPTLEEIAANGMAPVGKTARNKFGVQQASFESTSNTEASFCLAAINGEKVFSHELASRGGVNRENLFALIQQRVARMQFMKSNPQYLGWDDSLMPQMDAWLKSTRYFRPVTDSEISNYYQNNLEQFTASDQVRWESVSAVAEDSSTRSNIRRQLESVRSSLNNNRKVSPVSLANAEVQTFGWTKSGEIRNTALKAALFKTAVGKTSGIIEIQNRLMLVRILEKRQSKPLPLDQVANSIRNELEAMRYGEALKTLFETEKTNFKIWTVYDRAVDNHGVAPVTQSTEPALDLNRGKFEFEFRPGASAADNGGWADFSY